jgi:ABC-type Fe3+ transport system permease subunit
MSASEKRFKGLIALVLVIFVVVDYFPFMAWVHEQGGLAGANQDFWNHMFHSHLYKVTVMDLTGLAWLVFVWMIWDSRRRRHPWRPLLWLPVYLIAPAIASFGYLLTRGGQEFPPESR